MGGSYYLVADFEVDCGTSVHRLNMVLAWMVLLGLGAGLPLAIGFVFKKIEHAHKHKQVNFLVGKPLTGSTLHLFSFEIFLFRW